MIGAGAHLDTRVNNAAGCTRWTSCRVCDMELKQIKCISKVCHVNFIKGRGSDHAAVTVGDVRAQAWCHWHHAGKKGMIVARLDGYKTFQ